MDSPASKYDGVAKDFAERTYANLAFDMARRQRIVQHWGPTLQPGDSVLEVGCGNGYLAELFLTAGFRYTGIDVSPGMVAETEARLRRFGVPFQVRTADVQDIEHTEDQAAMFSFMGSFFRFVKDPVEVLRRLGPHVTRKVILDFDPRQTSVSRVRSQISQAGLRFVAWRPFFVPMTIRLPAVLLTGLSLAESIPLVRRVPLRWKFNCLILATPKEK